MKAQGIGASLRRKEDDRFLNGRGRYVSDIILPGQREVCFLRSPIAHGYLQEIVKPGEHRGQIFTWADLDGVKPMVADLTLPSYQASKYYPLANEKVRFVGEPIAMIVAPTRAQAEDIAELIEIGIEELPALVDARRSSALLSTQFHEGWADNAFLTLKYEHEFAVRSREAPVVVKRSLALARQTMVPLEGKAVVADWDDRKDQLVVYTSTQVPHIVRSGLSLMLGLPEESIRVVAPDVGGAFGYKCVLQPEEICLAWLASKFKKPFRYVEDRREHLTAGANTREHHYEVTAYANARGRLLALDAEIVIDSGAYSQWPWTIGLEGGQATGNLPGPVRLLGLPREDTLRGNEQAGFHALSWCRPNGRLLRNGARHGCYRTPSWPGAVGGPLRELGLARCDALR